jgi:hypothetical protein
MAKQYKGYYKGRQPYIGKIKDGPIGLIKGKLLYGRWEMAVRLFFEKAKVDCLSRCCRPIRQTRTMPIKAASRYVGREGKVIKSVMMI